MPSKLAFDVWRRRAGKPLTSKARKLSFEKRPASAYCNEEGAAGRFSKKARKARRKGEGLGRKVPGRTRAWGESSQAQALKPEAEGYGNEYLGPEAKAQRRKVPKTKACGKSRKPKAEGPAGRKAREHAPQDCQEGT